MSETTVLLFTATVIALVVFVAAVATLWEIAYDRWEARNEEVLLFIVALALGSAAFGVLRAIVMEVL